MKRSCMTLWIISFLFLLIYLLLYLWPSTFPGYELREHIFIKKDGMWVPNIQSFIMSTRYPNAMCALQSIISMFWFWSPEILLALHIWCVIFILKVYSGEMFCTVCSKFISIFLLLCNTSFFSCIKIVNEWCMQYNKKLIYCYSEMSSEMLLSYIWFCSTLVNLTRWRSLTWQPLEGSSDLTSDIYSLQPN